VIPSIAALTFPWASCGWGSKGSNTIRRARRAYAIGLVSTEIVSRFLVLGLGGVASGVFAVGTAWAAPMTGRQGFGLPPIDDPL
jgi:hypothetical protein